MGNKNDTGHEKQRWLTVQDLADRYGVTPTCIWLWVQAKRLPPPHRLGRQTRRWPPETIEEFEAESQVRAEK